MMYVVYEENTKRLLALINTEGDGACINGVAFKRYDEDLEPVFVQQLDGSICLKENAFIFHNEEMKR